MAKYLGVKNNRICIVSDNLFTNDELDVIEVPNELLHLSTMEIITDCVIKNGNIKYKNTKKNVNELKIALVGNYMRQCGISTYNEYLWPEIIKLVGDYKLFIEYNDTPTGNILQIGTETVSSDKVVSCWKRGKSLQELVDKLKEYDPDIILIGHEFGLWPNARYWLSMLTELSDYRVIVVMHSVFPNHTDKSIYEGAIKEAIVHLEAAKNNLEHDKNLNIKVHVIPHGCYPIINQTKLWDNYKSQHTFITSGFGFPYKSFESSIKATAILKEKYPDVFFTALFSESPQNKSGHQIYYNKLEDLVAELNIKENVSIIRGFQSDYVMDAYLRSNQAAVFPYQSVSGHEVFGASGACRLAMSKGLPVITSSIPHFKDTVTIKADSPEEIAHQLDLLFSGNNFAKEQIEKQNQFIIENSWKNIAAKYIAVLENI